MRFNRFDSWKDCKRQCRDNVKPYLVNLINFKMLSHGFKSGLNHCYKPFRIALTSYVSMPT
jgi:hypothetical protein